MIRIRNFIENKNESYSLEALTSGTTTYNCEISRNDDWKLMIEIEETLKISHLQRGKIYNGGNYIIKMFIR
uniref:Uncharacterized protein n=1 Tax=Acrobeloides nanus TaxID=290746 RepID=A0A914CTN7_9BILA